MCENPDRLRAMRLLTSGVVLLAVPLSVFGQNSTRKIRKPPSEIAAKAGSAVKWRASLEEAMAESAKSGKPLFWYVPTVARSRMDRKPEIDRYMMAGPFSWPAMIALLNDRFVPVKARATGEIAAKHRLIPMQFIEPGYLVLDAKGEAVLRQDQITTFHPQWLMTPLAKVAGCEIPRPKPSVAHGKFLEGVRLFGSGESDLAIALWKKLAETHADDPMGWKAAMEAEGHGPFRAGFEVFGALKPEVLKGETRGTRAPDGVFTVDELRKKSVDFLLRMQLSNGGWEDSKYDFGGTDSLPNVYVACSALIASALRRELGSDLHDDERIEAALKKADGYLFDEKNINPEDRDERIWAHVYRLYYVTQVLETKGAKKVFRARARQLAEQIFAMQPGTGCWYHEYGNPFVCAEVLNALHGAARHVQLDKGKVALGLKALSKTRAKNGSFSYGYGRRGGARLAAAAGRMPLCELALLRFGKSNEEDLQRAVATAFTHHDQLEAVRKYDDHAGPYGYGGFFFWFDMLGRTRAIKAMKDANWRNLVEIRQRVLITKKLPEIDGCFVDSHELGRTYGTAMALLCLAELRR